MNLTIRTAHAQDCARVLELVNELAVYERAPEEVTVTLDEFIDAGFGTKPVWEAFVATDDEYIVGFALFYTRYSTWKGRRIYLEDFYVTESYRGKGIGKILFEKVIEKTKELGFNGMTWQVLDWNAPALNFYSKYNAGMEAGWLNGSLFTER
ncbi:GNAT family N-acetyltransferase [Pedobacter sp. MC2016-14]|uniref:GNAT family N-acetyltransferase n=1 Tax=Pedobacter sp. MC2016-14 TaxID=2897327 RepID=UPI001E5F807B|nr:GNAT family N-acetyltransferase [Pedobacter sp. MC2016-14]MCD0487333.1 GNAT family N-acetyltransferase [Pedobacter sp. MC2016-14]